MEKYIDWEPGTRMRGYDNPYICNSRTMQHNSKRIVCH